MFSVHGQPTDFVPIGQDIFIYSRIITYRILSTTKDTGLLEFLNDATLIDKLQKSDTYHMRGGLRAYFEMVYGSPSGSAQ